MMRPAARVNRPAKRQRTTQARRKPSKSQVAWRLAAGALLLGASGNAARDGARAARPLTVTLGAPIDAVTTALGNPRRSRSAAFWSAPGDPVVQWSARVSEGITCDPLIDADGSIFVAGHGQISRLTADGTLAFSKRLDFERAQAAATTSEGHTAVVDASQRLWLTTREGGVERVTALVGVPESRHPPRLLPRLAGGVLVSIGKWHLQVGPTGSIRGALELPESVAQTLRVGFRSLLVGRRGGVFEWDGYGSARQLGSLGGSPSAVAATPNGKLVAIVDRRLVVTFDAERGMPRRLAAPERGRLLPLISATNAEILSVRTDGTLARVAGLEPVPRLPTGRRLTTPTPHLHLWSGGSGSSMAWVAADSPVSLSTSDSKDVRVPEARCSRPQALLGVGREDVLLACKSGQIWKLRGRPGARE